MKKLFSGSKIYLLVLLFFAITTHLQWFNPFSILNSSDWGYWPKEAMDQMYYSYGAWLNFFNLGSTNIQLTFNLFTSVWSLFSNFGLSYDLVTKITFLVPIAILGFLSPYILFNKLTKNKLIAFVVALFYGTTPYFLIRQTAHIPVSLIYALTPLIIYFFIKALEENRLKNWLAFVLIYWVSVCYEIRITYIVTFILLLYFIFFKIQDIKKYWKNIFLSILLLLGLNTFWLLPTIFGKLSEAISLVTNRNLFGSSLFSLEYAFNIYDSAWTGKILEPFVKQPIILYFWLIPLIAFSALLFKNLKYKKEITFFGIISLIGIFLTKQTSEPLAGAYLWLYKNFPGFSLFREASKFYLITAIGYTGLFAYALLLLKENKSKILNKYLFIIFSIVILFVSVLNTKPLITGEIRTMFIKRNIPTDYLILKDFILSQPEYFRTMYIPGYSRWGIFTNQKPKIGGISIVGNGWKNLLEIDNRNEKFIQDTIINAFKLPSANNLFDVSSIKYVVIPIQDVANDDDFFVSYGGKSNTNIRNWYISELDKINWLKKININAQDLVIYENTKYKSHIYSDGNLNYYQTNASEFNDFNQNQNLYLNSKIGKNEYLLNRLNNIVIPVEADQNKIDEMESIINKTSDLKEKNKLQSEYDLYANNLFLKDFKLQIPIKSAYNIYIKKDSVLINNKNINIQIDNHVLEQGKIGLDKEGWHYFNQIELEKGGYDFKIYIDNLLIDYINPTDIVLAAENLVEPIQTPQLEYKQINPTKYIVNVYGAKESFPLIFSESFHPEWKIYIQPNLFTKTNGRFASDNNQGTIQNENLVSDKFYSLLFRKSVLNDKHFLINSFANAWLIDIDELEKQNKIIKNQDGNYDFSIIIEFEPQKYFYIGLLISGFALLSCLLYLFYKFYHNRV